MAARVGFPSIFGSRTTVWSIGFEGYHIRRLLEMDLSIEKRTKYRENARNNEKIARIAALCVGMSSRSRLLRNIEVVHMNVPSLCIRQSPPAISGFPSS